MKIGTGCQDGLLRIYDTCQPTAVPTEIKVVANTATDGISKISWSTVERDTVFLGKKTSTLEKWDLRQDPSAGAVAVSVLPNSTHTVMDFEVTARHNVVLAASGNRVYALAMDTLQVVQEYEMPSPMNFHNEGGVSLCPDGTKFFAVLPLFLIVDFTSLFLFHFSSLPTGWIGSLAT